MADLQATTDQTNPKFGGPFVACVRVRNYKSIGKCDVRLSPLSVLVGRNGSGKSNFLDALHFIGDALQTSLDHAIRGRGGLDAVRRRSTGHPRNFAVEVELNLPNWHVGTYGFEVAARREGGFAVKRERLIVRSPRNEVTARYDVQDATVVQSSNAHMPPAASDRLYLVTAAGLPEFRAVYDGLLEMGFYNLNPGAMQALQSPDAGELLRSDGSNIASVIARLDADQPEAKRRIRDYLETIVPGITSVDRVQFGPQETLQFGQEVTGSRYPWSFFANSMSDGTLRALGALVAVAQLAGRKAPVRLVGIEEPETALHPAAGSALMDALREAAAHTQILVTTHSPDLLDQLDTKHDALLAVQAKQGTTGIASVDAASLQAIQQHLYSPGELLRMDQLDPDENDLRRQQQLRLFDIGDEDDT
jgi:predicted ATPase